MTESEVQRLKSKLPEQEQEILDFWRERNIFEKTLEKNKNSGKEFVFYEGPPTANGRPGIHHLEARAFKDAIPRYKTMRGFYVRRKGGWDTHGLPVELQVEKELGLKSKKEIEQYGIAAFNERCRESVWKYVREWEDFTRRSGYWVDLKDPYVTYKPEYIESVWKIIKTVSDKGLLYKDYKVVPWCPRCGTGLSSHELAQGYQDVKDLSVYVKFPIRTDGSEAEPASNGVSKVQKYLLAWTTTPWTLPGNVGLAVGKNIEYVEVEMEDGVYILARERLSVLKDKAFKEIQSYRGKDLVGLSYIPLYSFIADHISGVEKEKLPNAYKVYAADFVTTADGTGIVHTAVMYGQDDFELGNKVGLPKFHLVKEDGTFTSDAGFLAGKFVKSEETDVAIIKDLAGKNLLFAKEKYEHSYPFCWRCKTPLIYFARDSWYIKMSALRDKLVKENEKIHWEPAHIKEGRFGEWLREIKDWAISRERYWGTPLPVWKCEKCLAQKVVGSMADIVTKPRNRFIILRHGVTESNIKKFLNTDPTTPMPLTEEGRKKVSETAQHLARESIDVIFTSPFPRTKETAEIVRQKINLVTDSLIEDARLSEISGKSLQGMTLEEFGKLFSSREERFIKPPPGGGETFTEIKRRLGQFLYDIDARYLDKTILIVTHEAPAWLLLCAAQGLDVRQSIAEWEFRKPYIETGESRELVFSILPHNADFELDVHRPYIDEVKLKCDCGEEMSRVKEVMDVWFDSGAMPFAQDAELRRTHAEERGIFLHLFGPSSASVPHLLYPADFISEAIDQTRGWFYTLHAIGVLMDKGQAYKNVVCLGHILDADGKKMSKSVGNVVDPFVAIEKFGADPLRFWMYSINQPGDAKNFDERTVDEVVKKVFNLAGNVLAFYQLYSSQLEARSYKLEAVHVLDRWILARLNQLTAEVTLGLDSYKLLEPTRAIRDFIADLSQWYLRRSRDRFKAMPNLSDSISQSARSGSGEEGEDKQQALATTRFVLLELSKLMAPFTPFFAEYLYKQVDGEKESVHLEEWPKVEKANDYLLSEMDEVRKVVSLALEARAKANMKVRQPLASLKIKNQKSKLGKEMLELIRDEVNVKEVLSDSTIVGEVELDITITPELKKEGEVREMVRQIQELRKEKGLKPGELVILATSSAVAETGLLQEFEIEVKKTTSLSKIEHGTVSADFELK